MNPQPEPTGPHFSGDSSRLNLSKLVAPGESILPAEADTSVTAFVAHTTLEKALRYARKRIRSLVSPENPFLPNTPPVAAGPVEETQTLARREASERLDKATFIDGMSM